MTKGHCCICKSPLAASKQEATLCHRKLCRAEYKHWAVANYDQLDDANKFKVKYEDEFWKVTPEQKKQFSRFYELMKPRANAKKCSCLKCGKSVGGDRDSRTQYRLCPVCQLGNTRLGGLAYA